MLKEVELITEAGAPHRALLRSGTAADRTALVATWVPALMEGPVHWLDRDWPWGAFGVDELHLELSPEWLVIADDLEQGASGELLGVLVTTGPATARRAGIDTLLELEGEVIWVENIAIAPCIRQDCRADQRRKPHLKGVGPLLMREAIARSAALGLEGRIGLHAEGEVARKTYEDKWEMRPLGEAAHRAGGTYPVYFGDAEWAARFGSGTIGRARR